MELERLRIRTINCDELEDTKLKQVADVCPRPLAKISQNEGRDAVPHLYFDFPEPKDSCGRYLKLQGEIVCS